MSIDKVKFRQNKIAEFIKFIIGVNETATKPISVEIIGTHGIGKTSLVIDTAKSAEKAIVKINLAQIEEVAELVGFPIREFRLNDGTWVNEKQLNGKHELTLTNATRTSWCPPKWVPEHCEKGGILLLDDWTRADTRIIQAVMELIDRGEYISWKLPKGWSIILTSNPNNGDYSVNSLDSAQETRFHSLEMEFKVDDWAEWAELNGIDSRCINFVLLNKDIFEARKNATPVSARTATTFFSSIANIKNLVDEIDMVEMLGASSVGSDFTQKFILFVTNKEDLIPGPSRLFFDLKPENAVKELKSIIGDATDNSGSSSYRTAVAFVIATRMLNFIKEKHDDKQKNIIIKALIEFLTSEVFAKDVILHMKTELARNPLYSIVSIDRGVVEASK